jgi:hypothetical protein
VDKIRWALEAGINRLGENKVQEGQSKKQDLSTYAFEFHLIGPLQKNKVNKAVTTFDWIETVDSFELALRIDRACASMDKVMPVLLQVNLDMEPTKSGVSEDGILELVEQIANGEFGGDLGYRISGCLGCKSGRPGNPGVYFDRNDMFINELKDFFERIETGNFTDFSKQQVEQSYSIIKICQHEQ